VDIIKVSWTFYHGLDDSLRSVLQHELWGTGVRSMFADPRRGVLAEETAQPGPVGPCLRL